LTRLARNSTSTGVWAGKPWRVRLDSDDQPVGLSLRPEYRQRVQPIRNTAPKVGRNDPCPCGSGKKYKKCCGK